MWSKNYYEILWISKNASSDEIKKKSFWKLAMKYHPDRNKWNIEAENKFKEINEAYENLGDESKKNYMILFDLSDFEDFDLENLTEIILIHILMQVLE